MGNLLKKLQNVINGFIAEKEKRFLAFSQKMNEDYDWFFRHQADDMFVVNLELKQLRQLLDELDTNELNNYERMVGWVDDAEHYYLQKLAGAPVTVCTNIPMNNLANVHEHTVWQNMYRTMGKIRSIVEKYQH